LQIPKEILNRLWSSHQSAIAVSTKYPLKQL
jgi:hypothetical protein